MDMPSVARILIGTGGAAVVLYAAAVVLLAGCQSSLIYIPAKVPESAARAEASARGFLPWEVDGRLIGWRSAKLAPGALRLVVFHGNAGMALDRARFRDGFVAQRDAWEV